MQHQSVGLMQMVTVNSQSQFVRLPYLGNHAFLYAGGGIVEDSTPTVRI